MLTCQQILFGPPPILFAPPFTKEEEEEKWIETHPTKSDLTPSKKDWRAKKKERKKTINHPIILTLKKCISGNHGNGETIRVGRKIQCLLYAYVTFLEEI